MEKAQREYYLREQIKAIQVELGERDEKGKSETEELKEARKASCLRKPKQKVLHEIHRLSAWRHVRRSNRCPNYIDYFSVSSSMWQEILTVIITAQSKLKSAYWFLAVRQLTAKGPILCLVGRPSRQDIPSSNLWAMP